MMCLEQILTRKNIGWILNIYGIEAVTLLVMGFIKGQKLKKQNKRREKK